MSENTSAQFCQFRRFLQNFDHAALAVAIPSIQHFPGVRRPSELNTKSRMTRAIIVDVSCIQRQPTPRTCMD